jgi:hypothetical protein
MAEVGRRPPALKAVRFVNATVLDLAVTTWAPAEGAVARQVATAAPAGAMVALPPSGTHEFLIGAAAAGGGVGAAAIVDTPIGKFRTDAPAADGEYAWLERLDSPLHLRYEPKARIAFLSKRGLRGGVGAGVAAAAEKSK